MKHMNGAGCSRAAKVMSGWAAKVREMSETCQNFVGKCQRIVALALMPKSATERHLHGHLHRE